MGFCPWPVWLCILLCQAGAGACMTALGCCLRKCGGGAGGKCRALLGFEPSADQEGQLRQALALASTGGAHAIPSDWLVNDCPEIWTDDGGTRRYSWYQPAGLEFSDMPERYDGYLSAI